MRVRLVRLFLLAASVCCTMVLLTIVRYSADNKNSGISEEDELSENLQRRVLTGRVAAISPTRGREYMFMKKMLFDRIEANESISKVRKSNITAISVVARESIARKEPEKEERLTNVTDEHPEKGKSLSPMSDDNEQSEICHPRRTKQRMENIFGPKFNSSLDVFCTLSSLRSIYAKTYPLPFGFKGVETQIRILLQKLPEDGLPDNIQKIPCRRCMVVGNGGLLKGSGLGQRIDGFDVVIRLNIAPTEGYEKDVGSKTTMRLIYPESSVLPAHQYIQPWILLVVPFKSADLQWTDYVVDGRNMSTLHGFWSRIADFVPKAKQHIRIFNPAIISETASRLIGFKLGTGKMNKNVPTTGVMAIMAALRMCDEVSVSGFGYDTSRPDALVHYYSETDKMKMISTSWTHDIPPERKMLRSLVEQGVIQDETKGLR